MVTFWIWFLLGSEERHFLEKSNIKGTKESICRRAIGTWVLWAPKSHIKLQYGMLGEVFKCLLLPLWWPTFERVTQILRYLSIGIRPRSWRLKKGYPHKILTTRSPDEYRSWMKCHWVKCHTDKVIKMSTLRNGVL